MDPLSLTMFAYTNKANFAMYSSKCLRTSQLFPLAAAEGHLELLQELITSFTPLSYDLMNDVEKVWFVGLETLMEAAAGGQTRILRFLQVRFNSGLDLT